MACNVPSAPSPFRRSRASVRGLGGRRLGAALLCVALPLAGCAGFSADGGFGTVREVARERAGKDLVWARDEASREAIARRIGELRAAPLDADAAVQLALLGNRGLQADFYALGIAEADLVQAGRLPNPGFGYSRLTRGDELEIERGIHFDLVALLSLPLRREIAARGFQRAQAEAAARVLDLAFDARRAWIDAVAAEEALRYAAQVLDAADAGAELARRMERAGNFSALAAARERAFHADAVQAVTRARQARVGTRERLARLLGLQSADDAAFRLPERLPDLPAAPGPLAALERSALEGRLDLQAARLETERTARDLGLTRATRFVNVFEVGALRNGASDEPVQRGWEVGFEIPLFDGGGARVARARSLYMQQVERTAQLAVDARSQLREAHAAYTHAWEAARHQRDEIVPLRRRIARESLLRYNGMLIGVFELLGEARAQVASVDAAMAATRDFWHAAVELERAQVGPPQAVAAAASGVAKPAAREAGH